MSNSKEATIEEAYALYRESMPSAVHGTDATDEELQEARKIILENIYDILYSELRHTDICVLEDLTGIDYD